jgi:murein peptide amidase A
VRPRSAGVPPQWQVAAHSIQGHPIDVLRCGTRPGGVLIVGGTHGDEPGSAALVRELAVRIRCPAEGTLTIVPALNPDGLGLGERTNARGVDLNRNMPTHNWVPWPMHGPEPMSEPESRALYDLLLGVRPYFTISVHQAGVPLVDWDGPADDAARALGACTGLAAQRIGAMPGSLGSLLGVDWGWPLVTLELPPEASRMSGEALWATYGDCLLAAVGQ